MEIEIVRSFLETIHDGFVVGGVFVEGLGYTEKQREIEKYIRKVNNGDSENKE